MTQHRLITRFLLRGTGSWGERTTKLGTWQLGTFAAHLDGLGLDARDVHGEDGEALLDAYVLGLEQSGAWGPSAVQGMVQTLRKFYAWAHREGELDGKDPARHLRASRKVDEVPTHRITEDEHRAMLKTCNRRTIFGRRAEAILAVFWSTGVRRVELERMNVADIDGDIVMVRTAKGGPLGPSLLDEEALDAVDRYLDKRRPQLDGDPALFVTHQKGFSSTRLGVEAISATVRDAAIRARLPQGIACHGYKRSLITREGRAGATQTDLEVLGHWRRGSKMPGRYMGSARADVAMENIRRRRAEAAQRSRKRRA